MSEIVKLLGPTGNKAPVQINIGSGTDEGFFGPDLNNLPQPIDLLAWETEGAKTTELEVLVYPRFLNENGVVLAPDTMLPTFAVIRVEARWSAGAGSPANATSHSTFARADASPSDPVERAQWHLPDHGLKFRVACRTLRIRLHVMGGPTAFIAVASATPVFGGSTTQVLPPVTKLADRLLIPPGAREFRVFPMTSDGFVWPGQQIEFSHPFYVKVPPLLLNASECTSWTTIPGQFTTVRSGSPGGGSWTTIQFR